MTDQLDIFTPVARSDDPDTSWDAARSVDNLRDRQAAVLRVLQRSGGLTDEGIAARYDGPRQSPSGLRTRRKELVDLGLVKDSGERQRLTTGRQATVWVAA